MQERIRWGILGTGSIARKFAADLALLPDAELAAVGSRSAESAETFGAEFHIPRRHPTYEALVADPAVDAVYVANTNQAHRDSTLLCLEHGKAVLCEKPFALNAREAETMVACAKRRGVFLMEAMWTRYFPLSARMIELLRDGAIGEIRQIDASFCFGGAPKPDGRLMNPQLGGGSLLDVGVYPVAWARMILDESPAVVRAVQTPSGTGVDAQAAILFRYATGALARLTCAVTVKTRNDATVYGSKGLLRMPEPFWRPETLILERDGQEELFSDPKNGHGYFHEAREVMRCLRAGQFESPAWPLATTLAVMQTLDRIRAEMA